MRLRKEDRFIDFEVMDTEVAITEGKIGEPGETRRKTFGSNKAALTWVAGQEEKLRFSTDVDGFGWYRTARPIAEADPTKRAELIAAVIAAPDDDGPRQVMADWLTEVGDPQGELILLQLSLAKPELDENERESASERSRAILKDYGLTWQKQLRDLGVEMGNWNRGFIETITIEPKPFIKNATKILSLTPVRKIRIVDYQPSDQPKIRQLAGRAELEWVRKKSR
jgi:uncharacterized protein (TIGR02996 family)